MPTSPRERAEEKEMSVGFLIVITERISGINMYSFVFEVGESRDAVMEQLPHKIIYFQWSLHLPNP